MGKHEMLTPKAIAKRIKAKGLQKLRWFCQMCSKQCRDANGFKCHMESESHQRQMSLFGSNAGKFIDDFSKDFERGFLDIVKRMYKSKRVHANVVYNEYIKDRDHVHMNATRWVTLTGFVMYLGKTGKCKVEETPKGWYIQYIERDPEVLAQQDKIEKRQQMSKDDDERIKLEVEKRMKMSNSSVQHVSTELKRDQDHKISFSLGPKKEATLVPPIDNSANKTEPTVNEEDVETIDYIPGEGEDFLGQEKAALVNGEDAEDTESVPELPVDISPTGTESIGTEPTPNPATIEQPKADEKKLEKALAPKIQPITDTKKRANPEQPSKKVEVKDILIKKKKLSAVEEIALEEERKKELRNRKDYWLTEGIVVKVLNRDLANGKYYKQKGLVRKLVDNYVAVIEMIDSGDLLKLDQNQLETVLPALGSRVKIVNGAYRTEEATLLSINTEKFHAEIRIETGPRTGSSIYAAYEDICKIAK